MNWLKSTSPSIPSPLNPPSFYPFPSPPLKFAVLLHLLSLSPSTFFPSLLLLWSFVSFALPSLLPLRIPPLTPHPSPVKKKRDWPHNINGYLNLRHSCNKTFGGKTLQCLHMLQSVSSWWVVSSILSNVHPPLPLPSFIPKTFPSQNNGFARLHGIW